jgi:hypothetical protein
MPKKCAVTEYLQRFKNAEAGEVEVTRETKILCSIIPKKRRI